MLKEVCIWYNYVYANVHTHTYIHAYIHAKNIDIYIIYTYIYKSTSGRSLSFSTLKSLVPVSVFVPILEEGTIRNLTQEENLLSHLQP